MDQAQGKYISGQFGGVHDLNKIDQEYKEFNVFFKYNYLKHLPENKDKKIIDVACGLGHTLNSLKENKYTDIEGIDISVECVNFCQKKGFSVKEVDASNFFQDKEGVYDFIIMNDIIEHIEKDKIISLLSNIRKSLKDGGKLIIKTPNAANGILGLEGRYMDFTHKIIFSAASIKQVLKIAGYKDFQVYPSNLYVFYKNPLNYVALFMNCMFNMCLKIYFKINGKMAENIFTKNIIAIGKK